MPFNRLYRSPLARALLIAIVAVIIAIAAIWLTTPLWAPALLRSLLVQHGWQLDRLELQRPAWYTLSVDTLALSQPAPSHTRIEANDIVLRYRPRELLSGELERIDIAVLRAQWEPAASATNDVPPPLATLLPSAWLPQLPFASAHVGAIELRTPWPQLALLHGGLDYRKHSIALHLRSDGSPDSAQTLQLNLLADATNQIDLDIRDAERAIAAISNRFTTVAATPDTAAHTAIAGSALLNLDALQPFIPTDTAQLSGNLQANWQGELPAIIDDQWPQKLRLDGDLRSSGAVATAALPRVQSSIASRFQWRDGVLSGSIEEGAFNLLLPMPDAIAKRYALKPNQTLAVDSTIVATTRYRAKLAERSLEMNPVRIDARVRNRNAGIDSTLTIDELFAQSGDRMKARAHVALITPALPISTMKLRPAQLTAALQLDNDKLDARWQLRDTGKIYGADGTLTYDTQRGDGAVQARLQPLAFRENGSYLPAIFNGWPWPLDFSGGELTAQGSLRWNKAGMHASGSLGTKKLAGFYNRNLFRGVDAKLAADYRSYTHAADRDSLRVVTEPISIAEIQSGIPVRNIAGTLQFENDVVQVQNFRATLFDGEVTQPDIRYDLHAEQNTLALQLNNLQLAQMLALQDGVEGTGVIDGNLPLLLHKNGLRIDGAKFQARAPGGVLRYRGGTPAGAQQNPGLALAFKALENFHYDNMSVQANFSLGESYGDQSGDMLLAVALKGRNPTAPDTPPVNFNLNIRENIPDLIQTLQIGEDISDRIEQRIKKLQQTRNKNDKGAAP